MTFYSIRFMYYFTNDHDIEMNYCLYKVFLTINPMQK